MNVSKPTYARTAVNNTTPSSPALFGILEEIASERARQDERWGVQDHTPAEWLMILGEEVGEVNKAALEASFSGYDRAGDLSDYRKELIQVAAVAAAMIESLDRVRSHEQPESISRSICRDRVAVARREHGLIGGSKWMG